MFAGIFKAKEKAGPDPLKGLSVSDRKAVEEVKKKYRKNDGTPRTAQQSIPFERMFPDGICRVTEGYYTKTIVFKDINYQLAQPEDKKAIFEEYCAFLNFFDSSVHFQLSFMNMSTDRSEAEKQICIRNRGDGFDDVREEYSGMLKSRFSEGNNGLTKTKYLTFGIHADSLREAKPKLTHIQADIINNFKTMDVIAEPLDGEQRLKVMHAMFHMADRERFLLKPEELIGSGLSVKDYIAPTSFSFPNGRTFTCGSMTGAMSFLEMNAADLNDEFLKKILDMESNQIVTMHIRSVDQTDAVKNVKHAITELDRSKIEEQKKAVRSGYDMDIIPSDLASYGTDAKALLKELQKQNERMFMVTFLIMNTGKDVQELNTNIFHVASLAQQNNCNLRRLDFQQEQGLMSCLPLAANQIEIERGLTTSSTAIFIPFTTQELFQESSEALYYGLNALSSNLIMVDRKKLKNPNGLILGTPGSGKSFAAKREIANAFFVTDDDIIICDPENEYAALVLRLKGEVIRISPSSKQFINPMDISMSKRLEMIRQELEKLKKKRTRLEEQIRELEEKYQETENTEIHEIVHAANLTPEQLAKLLKNLQQGLPQGKLPAVVLESTKKQDEKENGGENSNEV